LDWQAWLTLGVVLLVLVELIRGVAPTDMVVIGGAVLLALAGVITPRDLLAGFSNDGVLTVAALFVIAAGLRETGGLDRLGGRMLGHTGSERGALLSMAFQVTTLSAFLNNTAVVAMLIPVVTDWCRKNRISPSRLLMPLSYLTVLGGVCTLIGTSTNLVVNGLLRQASNGSTDPAIRTSLAPMPLFELAWVGVPCAVLGAAYILLIGRRLLPDRKDLLEQLGETAREYLVDMRIEPNCPLNGKRVQEAGLRQLPGLFLIEIVRDGRIIAPVEPDETLLSGDRLTFTGVVSTIVDLERIPGLVPAADENFATDALARRRRRYCEAVVSNTSPLVGKNIRDANFRATYNAAVVAVHRGGTRLVARIGDIVLRPGDTLLLQSGPNFAAANRNNPDFYLVSSLEEARPVRHERAWISLALLGLLIILLLLSDWIPTVVAAFVVAGLMIILRCISPGDARRTVNLDILLTIAGAFGLGIAIQQSGLAAAFADALVSQSHITSPVVALAIVYGATMLVTELITNNAAAVLMFPIALAVADALGANPRPFAMAVTVAASLAFATPIGYQTNLMVYGPGGYRFSDFTKVGLPLNFTLWFVAVTAITMFWSFAR
jgi:di/tricarboxylate transporter